MTISELLQRLEEASELRLPSIQKQKSHPGSQACSPIRLSARSAPQARLKRSLSELSPVRLRLATTLEDEALWNEYVERWLPGAPTTSMSLCSAIDTPNSSPSWPA